MEWTISIARKNALGDVCRQEVRIEKSDECLLDGDIGLSIDDGQKIVTALQSAVVNHEAETYALFRRVCPDCHMFRPVKDYTMRRIRTVFGTVRFAMHDGCCARDVTQGMVAAFAPLKEICPDRVTSELMELTARLGSMMPYRQAASVLAEFLPIEPTKTHATVRKRTIKVGERLDDQITEETWRPRMKMEERHQLEMQLPGDRRKEFVISIDTAHVRSADPNSARNFELVVARCGRGGRGEVGGRYFVTANTDQPAIRDGALHALREEGYCGFGDVTVISDGAEILKRLPRAMPKPTTHIIDWFHIAMKIQPMQKIADHVIRSSLVFLKYFRPSAPQPRVSAPHLRPFEPQCDRELRKALPSRTSRGHDPCRVGGQFCDRQTHGQEAADALVSTRCSHADAGSDSRDE
ncbi:hypothetical protein [Mesorhizobium sp. M0244]|uniref:hypothetical protein n=1 Tax=Mesorhizobium sp. M0244 TaxID=2956926 RepID=UPI003338F98F